jgi:hypothetical protein
VGYIEKTGMSPGGKMFLYDALFVLDGHIPAAEIHHFGPESRVAVMQYGFQ